jgi:hypothetical protein
LIRECRWQEFQIARAQDPVAAVPRNRAQPRSHCTGVVQTIEREHRFNEGLLRHVLGTMKIAQHRKGLPHHHVVVVQEILC